MKILLLITAIIFCDLFADDMTLQSRELPTKEMKSQNKTIVKLAADEMSKSLPFIVDKVTTLVAIKANEATLEYVYEINISPKSDKSVQGEDHSKMQKNIIKGTCKSSKRFLEADISIAYIYISSKSKTELFRFNIEQKSCFKL